MSVTSWGVSVGLFTLACFVVWLPSQARQSVLTLMAVSGRLVLSAAIVFLAAAAFGADLLIEQAPAEVVGPALGWLQHHVPLDLPLTCSWAALGLVLLGLPLLIALDFARALAGHAAWLKRVQARYPAPGQRPPASVARTSGPRPSPVATPAPAPRRSLDELLG